VIDESLWIDLTHGMELEPDQNPNQRDQENGILTLVVYYYLKDSLGKLTEEDVNTFKIIVDRLRTYDNEGARYEGLFDRGAGESLKYSQEEKEQGKLRTISHDNLTAIASFSYFCNLDIHKHIVDHGKKHFWRFDNVFPEKPRWSRIMLPRDIIYWSFLNKSLISKFFLWWFYVEILFSCLKKTHRRPTLFQRIRALFPGYKLSGYRAVGSDTSGKHLTFVRLYPLMCRGYLSAWAVWYLCEYICSWHWKEGFFYVFKNRYREDHPVRILAEKVFT